MPITLTILQTFTNILIFLVVLSLVINIHELGHLFFAKRAGILCHEYSFGMGPRLWSTKRGETVYSIRAIPFGGYVSMAGEEIESDIIKAGQKVRLGFDGSGEVTRIVVKSSNPNFHDFLEVKVEDFDLFSPEGSRLFINEFTVNRKAMYVMDKKHIQITPKDRSFTHKSKLNRFLVAFGGPLMNFVLAYLVYLIIAFAVGVPNTAVTEIGAISPDAPAGIVVEYDDENIPLTLIRAGDLIISIDGVEVNSWDGETNSVSSELSKANETVEIVIVRDGETIVLENIIPQWIFYGLGFMSTVGTDELIISSPLYLDSEIKSGDRLVAIESVPMNSWADVRYFAESHSVGSSDKNDLYDFMVYRLTTSEVLGTVTGITRDDQTGFTEIAVTLDDTTDDPVLYNVKNSESLLVQVGDAVEVGTQLSSGGYYTFSHIIYGTDVLDAMGYTLYYSRIGITSTSQFSFFGSFASAWDSFLAAGSSIFKTLGLLFSSNLVGISDLSGFIGIFSMTSAAAAGGMISLLSWIGLLSVNLGIVNLLPVPALDGGRIVFIGYEVVAGKKPNQKIENMLHTLMFFLLMAFLVFITYNDILRLFGLK